MNLPTTGTIRFVLNDREVNLTDVPPRLTLLDWLRLDRRLTGSKEGCAEGDCGACTVLVGRMKGGRLVYETVNSCIRFVGTLNATHVVTIEHLSAEGGALHPVQEAMVRRHGSQCGFCTPGIVMSLYALWLSEPEARRPEIERALQGNLCRCTGYEPIIEAAEDVLRTRPDPAVDPVEAGRARIAATLLGMATGETIRMAGAEGTLIVPADSAGLAEVLSAHPHGTIVAGSTDVGLWVTKQHRAIDPVIAIGHLEELQAIRETPDGLEIGAGVTYSEAMPALARLHPALGRLVERIGGEQVRNMGTIGGNIANGSPIGDTPPALIALGATLTLRSREGTRTMALEDFFITYGKQDRERHEFVESVLVPPPAPGALFAVHKISKRRDEDISALCGAFHIRFAADGAVAEARIAFGGMAGTPKRAAHAEAALVGRLFDRAAADAAAAALAADYQPLTDWRGTGAYRMKSAQNLFYRLLAEHEGQPATLDRFATGGRA